MTNEQQTRPSKVVLERRRQLKAEQRSLKQELQKLKDDLSTIESENYLYMAQNTPDDGGFKSKLSDHKGRKAELDLMLLNDQVYNEVKTKIKETDNRIQEIEDAISDINFYQRQRMVLTTDAFIESSDELCKHLKEFKSAVEAFIESRKSKP